MNLPGRVAIGRWLLLGVLMLVVQVWLGGITRLTGSGLSITEWDLLMGVVPPLNQHQWEEAFALYKQFPQYRIMNPDMDLDGFKSIFWWEYVHRLWGRLLIPAFLIPLIVFFVKKWITRGLLWRLLILFALGAVQGVVGWIMVASGLVDKPWVDPLKLALHLLLALLLIGLLYYWSLAYVASHNQAEHTGLHRWAMGLLMLLGIQFFFGALMAGYKAAMFYPTFPKMGQYWVPPNLFSLEPWWHNFFENPSTIHFIHRVLGYAIVLTVVAGFGMRTVQQLTMAQHRALLTIVFLTIVQFFLGIMTVLHAQSKVPIGWASVHQLVGVLLLLATLHTIYVSRKARHDPPLLQKTA